MEIESIDKTNIKAPWLTFLTRLIESATASAPIVCSAKDFPNEICVKKDLSMVRSKAEVMGKSKIEANVARMNTIVENNQTQAKRAIRFRRNRYSSLIEPAVFLTKKIKRRRCPIVRVADAKYRNLLNTNKLDTNFYSNDQIRLRYLRSLKSLRP